jgi:hypothetical protein
MADSAVRLRARQALAEILSDWDLCWLSWPACPTLARQLAPQAAESWFTPTADPASWAQQLQAFWHCHSDTPQPLVVVLELPADQDMLRALNSLETLLPWLVVLALDPHSWLAPVPSSGGWFQRSQEPPSYAWSSWLRPWELDFWGSLSLEEPKPIVERLDPLLTGAGRRLLHLYGPSTPMTERVQTRRALLSHADTLESAFLEQLPGLIQESTVLLWANSCQMPTGLSGLRCHPAQAASAAWGVHRAGQFPVLALSAGDLGLALQGLLPGLPPGCLLLLLEAGLCWEPGETHLAPSRLRDLALLRQVHGLALACPADVEEAAQLVRLSYSTETPFALRLTQSPAVRTSLGSVPAQAGRSHCLRQGQHAAIIALGPMVYASLLAAESLASWGLECQVWDVRFLKPLDREALEQASQTGHLLTVEEHCLQGGLATMTLETLSLMELRPKVQHLALPATPPIAQGTPGEEFGLDADGIQRAMRKLLGLAASML